jgi:hypothetical protein
VSDQRRCRRTTDKYVAEADLVPTAKRTPSPRTIGLAVGVGRTVVGAVFLAAPVASVRILGLDTATAARVTWLARMAAVRDVAIGLGTLDSVGRNRGARTWLAAGAAADLADAVVIGAALRSGRAKGVAAAGIVAGAAAAAVVGAWAARPVRRQD